MKKFLASFLSFSKKERWGIYVLSMVCLLAWFIPRFLSSETLQPEDLQLQVIDLEMKRNKILLEHTSINTSSRQKFNNSNTRKLEIKIPVELVDFDPNKITQTDWMKLGLNERMASGIIKYISKGGKFRKKEDLKRIYGMTDEIYNRLSPHILLEDFKSKVHDPFKKGIQPTQIDLNKADSIALMSLPGIGEKLSSRIIKFRDKLGGFVELSQLNEVYGLDSSVVEALKRHVLIEKTFAIKRIRVNDVTLEELKKHPYAGYKNAKLIIAYRNMHGKIATADELLSIGEIERDKIEKLIPYLLF